MNDSSLINVGDIPFSFSYLLLTRSQELFLRLSDTLYYLRLRTKTAGIMITAAKFL
jgi:hypothetical protein